jgi:hypothetical protein
MSLLLENYEPQDSALVSLDHQQFAATVRLVHTLERARGFIRSRKRQRGNESV